MNITLENLDHVEETDRQFFEETEDGKFKFNRAKLEETAKAGLIKKNRELLGKVKDFDKLSKFKDVADDEWTAYQEWKANRDEGDDDQNGDGKKPDAVDVKKLIKAELKKAQEAHAAQLKAKDDEVAAANARHERYVFDQELTAAALEHGVIGERLKKFKAAVIAENLFDWRDGKMVVLDEDGEPTTDTPAQKFGNLAKTKDWQFFFDAPEGGGSGAQKQKAASTGNGKVTRSGMSNEQKSAFITEHGSDAYLKLPLK